MSRAAEAIQDFWRASTDAQLIYGDFDGSKRRELYRIALAECRAELAVPAFVRKQVEFMRGFISERCEHCGESYHVDLHPQTGARLVGSITHRCTLWGTFKHWWKAHWYWWK